MDNDDMGTMTCSATAIENQIKERGKNAPQYIEHDLVPDVVYDFNRRAHDVLAHRRYTKESLEQKIAEEFGFRPELEEVDEEGCICDYAFIGGIGEHYGYIDIYFLRAPYAENHGDENVIYVTEVSASEE